MSSAHVLTRAEGRESAPDQLLKVKFRESFLEPDREVQGVSLTVCLLLSVSLVCLNNHGNPPGYNQ